MLREVEIVLSRPHSVVVFNTMPDSWIANLHG